MSDKPLFVTISDIHFSLNTLELASISLISALDKAAELQVPLIIAGDLNDSKAIIRGEVANSLINILSKKRTQIYIIIGNHDLLNEKSNEHSLNFLRPYVNIVDQFSFLPLHNQEVFLMPYQNDQQILKERLQSVKPNSLLIMHQGFLGAHMGEYVQDKTSISTSLVKDFRVFSGHYHRHQTLDTVTYIGSPYMTSFAEANDGSKGYLIINEDRTFKQVTLNLRRYIIAERELFKNMDSINFNQNDLLWLKLKGLKSDLNQLDKQKVSDMFFLRTLSFKYEPIVVNEEKLLVEPKNNLSDKDHLDLLIDNLNDSEIAKSDLKRLWRSLI